MKLNGVVVKKAEINYAKKANNVLDDCNAVVCGIVVDFWARDTEPERDVPYGMLW